jgi:hypothetical protein
MIRPATLGDVQHIFETMWGRGRTELTLLDVHPMEWLASWSRKIRRGDAVAFESHAILGCDWETPDSINTSFQASDSFEAPGVGRQVTREIRKAIPQLMRERGIRLSVTYSLCVDPQSEKWFRLLGLEEDKDYKGIQRGPYTTRRFIRRL